MATQRKGCGFLLTALIILLLGGGIAAFLGIGAFNSGKDFTGNIDKGESFVTPKTLSYTPKEDTEITAWISGDENLDLSKVELEFTNTSTGIAEKATKPESTGLINGKHLLAEFSAEKDKTYQIAAKGAIDNSTVWISNVSSDVIISMLGKGLGAFGVSVVTFLLTLVFGIIGLVKFLGSKKAGPTQAPPPLS